MNSPQRKSREHALQETGQQPKARRVSESGLEQDVTHPGGARRNLIHGQQKQVG